MLPVECLALELVCGSAGGAGNGGAGSGTEGRGGGISG